MNLAKNITVLFDFDGVIMDTESQYTLFWNEQGNIYLNKPDFGVQIKGQTLIQIYNTYFGGNENVQQQITMKLNAFERKMSYDYIPGAVDFINELQDHGVQMAVVTSSNQAKMQNVYRNHPEFKKMFKYILTGEMFTESKPSPECYLLAMKLLNSSPETTFIFEDSFHGLQSGTASGGIVIALATTNSHETLKGKSSCIIDDFTEMSYDQLLHLLK